ncbi:MAG TPA: aryl-sulfate sulfotransferase [Bryobacteraceae bacterium]|nr:aryl-sulfate sulfotransferase [Bryobacteraceae bacterium]
MKASLTSSLLAAVLFTPAYAQLSVSLSASLTSPQPAGAPITWRVFVSDNGVTPIYRFQLQRLGGGWNLVRDYEASNAIDWTTLRQGLVNMRVTAIDTNSGATGQSVISFQFSSRVTAGTPVVTPTANPLVAIYSAPPCSSGSLRVCFRPASGGSWRTTPAKNCIAGASLSFYVAGMRANTAYILQQQLIDGSTVTNGPQLTFQTGTLAVPVPSAQLLHSPDAATSVADDVLLTSFFALTQVEPQYGAIATDLFGNVIWYYAGLATPSQSGGYLVRNTARGTMLAILREGTVRGQVLREFDLGGNLVRETSVTALNRQLASMGKEQIDWMSHEALRLSNGHTLVLSSIERILTDVQGPGPVDVLGDLILDLDQNLQIVWTWNAFDFLDNSRTAVLDEKCAQNGSCGAPLRLAPVANDWTHGNSLTYLADGNIALSLRNQDWVIKINYADGAGAGNVIWRLGTGGDFTYNSNDPWPQFSHQHDFQWDGANYEVFDNGDTRVIQSGGGQSRGQVLALDETAHVATLLLNAGLGSFSNSWGSAQLLSNGNYQFMSGGFATSVASASLEYLPNGSADYLLKWPANAYRSFRLKSLYPVP